jgi:hypothetical protein
LTIVEVVGDMRREGLEKQAIAQIFRPSTQDRRQAMDLVVRTASDPSSLAPAQALLLIALAGSALPARKAARIAL